jgi:hypothetical protein
MKLGNSDIKKRILRAREVLVSSGRGVRSESACARVLSAYFELHDECLSRRARIFSEENVRRGLNYKTAALHTNNYKTAALHTNNYKTAALHTNNYKTAALHTNEVPQGFAAFHEKPINYNGMSRDAARRPASLNCS